MVLYGVGCMKGDLGSWGPCVGMMMGFRQAPLLPPLGPGVLPFLCSVCEYVLGECLARIATC